MTQDKALESIEERWLEAETEYQAAYKRYFDLQIDATAKQRENAQADVSFWYGKATALAFARRLIKTM